MFLLAFIVIGICAVSAQNEPTSQPSNQPTNQPSIQPTTQPSTQPSKQVILLYDGVLLPLPSSLQNHYVELPLPLLC
jgi:hypothetical protein